MDSCVSKGQVSPLTTKVKCPHGTGVDTDGAEAVTAVACDGFGGEGREARCVLPAGQTDLESSEGERGEEVDSR